mmetsp:Transcript_41311/g.119661  ORF Transcript_41311/g.119661 Transcript_41311/m.119661 type:complete len:206 (+) Transcript_41311:1116-1733(+)
MLPFSAALLFLAILLCLAALPSFGPLPLLAILPCLVGPAAASRFLAFLLCPALLPCLPVLVPPFAGPDFLACLPFFFAVSPAAGLFFLACFSPAAALPVLTFTCESAASSVGPPSSARALCGSPPLPPSTSSNLSGLAFTCNLVPGSSSKAPPSSRNSSRSAACRRIAVLLNGTESFAQAAMSKCAACMNRMHVHAMSGEAGAEV